MPSWVAIVLTGLAALQISLNLHVSLKLLRSIYFEPAQKNAQFILIWAIPIVGVLLVFLFLQGPEKDNSKETEHEDPEQSESTPLQSTAVEISSSD